MPHHSCKCCHPAKSTCASAAKPAAVQCLYGCYSDDNPSTCDTTDFITTKSELYQQITQQLLQVTLPNGKTVGYYLSTPLQQDKLQTALENDATAVQALITVDAGAACDIKLCLNASQIAQILAQALRCLVSSSVYQCLLASPLVGGVLQVLSEWLTEKLATITYTSNVKLLETGVTWCGEDGL